MKKAVIILVIIIALYLGYQFLKQPNKNMKLSNDGLKMLIHSEGVVRSDGRIVKSVNDRELYRAYQDINDYWTHGVGHLISLKPIEEMNDSERAKVNTLWDAEKVNKF